MSPFKANHDHEIDTVDSCRYKFHFRVVWIYSNSIQISLAVSPGTSLGKFVAEVDTVNIHSTSRCRERFWASSRRRCAEKAFCHFTSRCAQREFIHFMSFPGELQGETTRDIWIELQWIDTTRKWNLYLQESTVSISWSWFALNGDMQLYQLMKLFFRLVSASYDY